MTRVGAAAFKGSIDLELSQKMYEDLKVGLNALCLASYFHLLYLVSLKGAIMVCLHICSGLSSHFVALCSAVLGYVRFSHVQAPPRCPYHL